MSAPFLAGFVPTLGRSLRTALRGRRALILALALVVPPLLALPARDSSRAGDLLDTMVNFLFLQFLVPVVGLLFGTGVLADEASGGTLPYLFTRPVRRSSILLGKTVGATLLGSGALAASLAATFLLMADAPRPEGYAGRAFFASLLALPAYIAAFTMLSSLTRWGLLAGFLYAFGVEGTISLIPGMVKKITVLYYSRSLLGSWPDSGLGPIAELLGRGKLGVSPETAIAVLVGVTVVALVVTARIVARREFVARTS